MTTNANAPVETRHKDEAARAAGFDDLREAGSVNYTGGPMLRSINTHAQALANLEAARAENVDMAAQIDKLANFIMANVPGEPSQSEGAVDCAIRMIKAANNRLAEIDRIATKEVWSNCIGTSAKREIANLASGHTPSPCPSCNGLNTSCPEGCERDPLTGELIPWSCPDCAAKDEAMEAAMTLSSDTITALEQSMAEIADHLNAHLRGLSLPDADLVAAHAIAARFINPPADPVADALKAALSDWQGADFIEPERFMESLKSRGLELSRLPLGGAK